VTTRPSGLTSKLRRIQFSVASTGIRRGLADLGTLLLSYQPDRDHAFDRQFDTDTAGSVATTGLGIADDDTREQAILYLPSPPRVTRWMLDNIGIDHHEFSFVDLGCGKGRVLLVATHYPFQKVVGVEVSAALAEIARANAVRYCPRSRKCRDVQVENVDATKYEFPESDLLIHLYHPFESKLLSAVLSRLEVSVKAKPRKVVVAYLLYASATESVESVFSRFPWLKQTRSEQSVLGHYDWLFYST
jgi:SAM-dependent methyltransferase